MFKEKEQSIKEVLKKMVDTYRLKGKLTQTKINDLWQKNMGTTIANYTRELKVRREKLYVTIDSAPLRQELSMGREKIRKILNEELGEDYIKEVIIR